MPKRAFTTWQLLRYPVVFGTCIAIYFTVFSYRKTYFKEEIDQVRERNIRQSQESAARLEAAKEEVFAQRKKKIQT